MPASKYHPYKGKGGHAARCAVCVTCTPTGHAGWVEIHVEGEAAFYRSGCSHTAIGQVTAQMVDVITACKNLKPSQVPLAHRTCAEAAAAAHAVCQRLRGQEPASQLQPMPRLSSTPTQAPAQPGPAHAPCPHHLPDQPPSHPSQLQGSSQHHPALPALMHLPGLSILTRPATNPVTSPAVEQQPIIHTTEEQDEQTMPPSMPKQQQDWATASRTTDVAAWLFAVDLFFTISELTDAQRIVYVATLLSGHALLWYRSSVSSFTSWTCFVAAFERQFAPVNRLRHARDRLAALTQTSSVRRYLGEFTALCLEVTDLSPAEQLDRFIRGLKPSVRRELELREPTSFSEASTIADRVDAISYSTSASRSSYRPPSTPRPPRPETAAVPMELDAMLHTSPIRNRGTRLSDAQRAALRDSKACFYCRKAGHTMKDCPIRPPRPNLNLLSAPRFRRAARHDEVFMALLTQQPNPSSSPSTSTPAPDPPPLHPKAATLVQQYPSVFPKELPAVQDMPRRSVDHTIHLTGPAPSPRPIYRMSQPELDQLKKQLDDLLAKGFIRPSTSPFAAPVLFVRKKDGSLRLCVDFRALNQQTLKNPADHERHLHLTLSLLRQHQLCANLAKCAFWLDTVDFLGHVVSAAGIQPDPTKVKAVLDWPAPQDKHQLRSFLGTANYYRRLLHHHAHRVLPLTDLLRDEQPWRWGEAEQRAFADIKAAMASSPVVRPPDFSLPFTVKTDASLFAIGAVLTQQDSSGAEYVVAYESRKLNPAQVNYPAHERELLAVLHALTTWRHYLLGRPFIVETDNSATTHVLTQSNLTGRQMRWTQRLAEFDITFVHKAGKHHTVPDALSRRPDHQLTALSIVDPDPSFFSTFDRHAPEDPAYQAALPQVLSPPSPSSPTHLQVIEGRLYTTSTPPRLYIPSSPLRAQLLHEAHDAHTAAHLGRAKTLERLQRHFYWPQMHKTVQEYVRTCDKCQRNKATNQLPPGLLQPLPIPSRNWQQVSMDFIGPLPATPRGHTMIFTVVDKLSKMIHLIPTTTTATAHDTARLFFDHIFKHHGLPEAIISDRDPKFTSDFWTSLFHLTGTRLLLSSAYHPQTDGQTERANRTVEDMLRPYVNDHKTDWDQHLAAVEFAYNSSEHVGTGFTPFYLNYGQHPTTPSALLLPPPTLVPSQAAEDFVTSMRNNLTAARSALQRSIDTQKLHADQHRRHEEFEVGDLVLLSCANLNLQTAVNSAKLQPRFVGPFKVLAKHSPVSYKLDLPSSMRILPTFHISRLRPYLSSSSFPERAVELQPSPVIIDGEAYFTVEAILGRRWNDAQHAFQYLIKWAGYDDSFNSWEWGPALAQQDAVAALIRDYTARHHAPVDDDPACQVCASRSPRPPMLLCDQCDKGFHITCLSPPLRSVPRGAWLCHQCKQAKAPKKRR
ncbi:hypothetical protein QJQ45_001994 [Haematococcus lacustris]|nr:hypothetical protein QJQ45_001994 [Haematococcus lacustris]